MNHRRSAGCPCSAGNNENDRYFHSVIRKLFQLGVKRFHAVFAEIIRFPVGGKFDCPRNGRLVFVYKLADRAVDGGMIDAELECVVRILHLQSFDRRLNLSLCTQFRRNIRTVRKIRNDLLILYYAEFIVNFVISVVRKPFYAKSERLAELHGNFRYRLCVFSMIERLFAVIFI